MTDTSILSPLWHVSARVHFTAVEGMVQLFEQFGFTGVSWLECDDSEPSDSIDESGFNIASEFMIDGYTPNKPEINFLNGTIESLMQLMNVPTPVLSLSLVDNTDWLTACYQSMPARTIGDFFVYGSHITEAAPSHLHPVLVNAATAFGSGEHPTTTGCLTALSDVKNDFINQKPTILDMGCGSGILGISAKKKWPKASVIAADSDAESVRVTVQNAQNNETELTTIESMGFLNPAVSWYGPYHLVLANILAKPLCLLASDFAANMHKDGIIILSGLLSRHTEEVTRAYTENGFEATNSFNIDDWMTLVFRRV
jgi:ribosomal protein L11 methyltransferase